jgi:aminoglycoside phosphotransferase
MSGTQFDLRREAAVLEHVRAAGIPVPAVLASLDAPPGTLLEFVEGTSCVSASVADAVGAEYMGWIAETHRIDPTGSPLGSYRDAGTAVRVDLSWWRQRAVDDGIHIGPLVALAGRLLTETTPDPPEPASFVHGDVGPGNLIVSGGKVGALLDWELAHLGDWHEDLAWLWMRGAHSDFGDPQQRLAEYETASGRRVDNARLRWHLAFVMYKTVLALRSRLTRPGNGRLVVTQFVLLTTYEALLAWAMAGLCGIELPLLRDKPKIEVTPELRLVDRLADAIADDDHEAVVAIEHLRLAAEQRRWRAESHRADARRELGAEPDDLVPLISAATPGQLTAFVRVVGSDADRACWALPPAVRRVRRAQSIGLGI